MSGSAFDQEERKVQLTVKGSFSISEFLNRELCLTVVTVYRLSRTFRLQRWLGVASYRATLLQQWRSGRF